MKPLLIATASLALCAAGAAQGQGTFNSHRSTPAGGYGAGHSAPGYNRPAGSGFAAPEPYRPHSPRTQPYSRIPDNDPPASKGFTPYKPYTGHSVYGGGAQTYPYGKPKKPGSSGF